MDIFNFLRGSQKAIWGSPRDKLIRIDLRTKLDLTHKTIVGIGQELRKIKANPNHHQENLDTLKKINELLKYLGVMCKGICNSIDELQPKKGSESQVDKMYRNSMEGPDHAKLLVKTLEQFVKDKKIYTIEELQKKDWERAFLGQVGPEFDALFLNMEAAFHIPQAEVNFANSYSKLTPK